MKILQVIPYFAPMMGGDANFCYNLSTELSNKGHDVTVLTTDFEFDKECSELIKSQGVKVIQFKRLLNISFFLYSPKMKSWLEQHINDFDIVHMHTFRSYQNNLVYDFAIKNQIPYIIQAHGSVLPFFNKKILKKFYDFFWGYSILNHAKGVIAGTEAELKQYIEMGVKKDHIKVIPNAIHFQNFSKLPLKGSFKKKYSINKSEKIILYLGRISKIKGLNLLLNSFKYLNKHYSDFKLVIIGPDDGYFSYLEKEIDESLKSSIIFTGLVSEKVKVEAYVDADVYVLPSLYDNFPLTVLEALASGTPVIVTSRCLISNIVKNVGKVVEYDESSLNDAIIKILENDNLRRELGEKGRELIKQEYSFESVGKKFEKLYFDLKDSKEDILSNGVISLL